MQITRMHIPDWMHWHELKIHFDHMMHDPRFWAAFALIVLLVLMILATIFAEPGQATRYPTHPIYPYIP